MTIFQGSATTSVCVPIIHLICRPYYSHLRSCIFLRLFLNQVLFDKFIPEVKMTFEWSTSKLGGLMFVYMRLVGYAELSNHHQPFLA